MGELVSSRMASYDSMLVHSRKQDDLHGNAPDRSTAALLIVDMINDLDFPGNEELLQQAKALGRRVAQLKRRCRDANIPAIYINDNHGKWRSEFAGVVRHAMSDASLGRTMVQQVLPEEQDYLVLKPKHSIFYATPLNTLLEHIGAESLILAGLSTNSCILLSASDAYVRDYWLYIPSDCVAGQSQQEHRATLNLMEQNFSAVTTPSDKLDLGEVLQATKR